MAKYAVINENNIVINTILADSQSIAELVSGNICVEYTDNTPVGIGWTYKDGIFSEPVVEEKK
jgi:hypothetical protein